MEEGIEVETPDHYSVDSNHLSFFFNKGLYLETRYNSLVQEMKSRGLHTVDGRKFPIEMFPEELRKDWKPRKEDIGVARDRILETIMKNPTWYHKTDGNSMLESGMSR